MTRRGADWYRREPRAFLEGVRKLTEREIAVYAVVLDLIYDGGHQTLNDPKHIASYFSDLGSAAVRHAINRLVESGKLIIDGEFLTNKRAQNEGKTREELAETRRKSGRLGGVSSGVSRANSNKSNDLGEANAPYARAKDKIRKDIEVKEEPNGSSKRRGSRLPPDFVPDIEFAISIGLSRQQAESEAVKFREWWPAQSGQKGVKADWSLTWKTWCRKAVERLPQARGSPPRQPRGSDHFDNFAQELRNGHPADSRGAGLNRDDASGLPLITVDPYR